jgi:hypothetical protein
MKNLKKRPHERGFVLLAVYMAAIFICLFSVVLFARHRVAIQATERYQNRVLAFNAAEAGIDTALTELTTNKDSRRTNTAAAAYPSSTTSLGQQAFYYTISPVTDPDTGLKISTRRRIDATGCAPSCDATTRDYQTSAITVYASLDSDEKVGGMFDYGVFTTQSMNLSGMTFDSYDSAAAYGGANISSKGSVAANATASEKIELENSTVRGTVLVGESGNPNTVIEQEHSTIIPPVTDPVTPPTGNLPPASVWTLGAPTPMADLPPGTVTELGNALSGVTSSKTLAAGTYHCSQISVSGSKGKIVTTGPVKIYVDGGVEITGIGTTVPSDKPGNLQIYVTGTASCKVQGNGSFFGGLYAPNSDVTFKASNSGKGGVWFGAVVAKTFSTGGGGTPAFHYDVSMKTTPTENPNFTPSVSITTWQEMNSLAWGTGQTTP